MDFHEIIMQGKMVIQNRGSDPAEDEQGRLWFDTNRIRVMIDTDNESDDKRALAYDQDLEDHIDLITCGVHGSTSSNTANRIVCRDSNGRGRINHPSHDYDIATKWYVDQQVAGGLSDFFVTGRSIYLYENDAPTGWTIASVTDSLLAVKGGSNDYNINGGNTGGSWTAVGSHYHATRNHTLSVSQIPSHRHWVAYNSNTYPGNQGLNWKQPSGKYGPRYSGYTGGGGAHNHGNTYEAEGDPNWRPYAAVGIIIVKD